MINKRYITQWYEFSPWQNTAQIEQDLVISRAISEIYNNPLLSEHLVFRGGTALNKLFFKQGLRYSEDIDLVQFKTGPIGDLMTELHKVLDHWLGKPKYKQSDGRVTFTYKFETENPPVRVMKLKIEINTREHGSVHEIVKIPFNIENGWFSSQSEVKTYSLEELMGTKLRALYQRRKGRDLFDLYQVLKAYPHLNCLEVIYCFKIYLSNEGLRVSRAEFEENMTRKIQNPLFEKDIYPLLPANITYKTGEAYPLVHDRIISLLEGAPWEGIEHL